MNSSYNPNELKITKEINTIQDIRREDLRTPKQWLKEKRYPLLDSIPFVWKGYKYYAYEQTKAVKSSAHYAPLPGAEEIPDLLDGKSVYFDGQAERVDSKTQWQKRGRVLKEGAFPFDRPTAKFEKGNEIIEVKYYRYRYSETVLK